MQLDQMARVPHIADYFNKNGSKHAFAESRESLLRTPKVPNYQFPFGDKRTALTLTINGTNAKNANCSWKVSSLEGDYIADGKCGDGNAIALIADAPLRVMMALFDDQVSRKNRDEPGSVRLVVVNRTFIGYYAVQTRGSRCYIL